MVVQNPFSNRNMITDPDEFFGRNTELMTIFSRLENLQSCDVYGERKIGKSSLLYYIFKKAQDRLGSDYVVGYIDMQAAEYHNVGDFLNEMRSSLKGCRKIACDFNMEMSMNGEKIRISKSKVNDIIREEKNYQIVEVKQLSGHLFRPSEPSIAFAMDFTEKVIAGGDRAHILNILDKYNNEKIILDAHKSQDADAVIYSLEKLDRQLKHSGITITTDNGKEFKNNRVADYCSKNNIRLNFVNPGSPWENGFVERDMRTLKEECLNLIWINDIIEIQPILDNYKQEYNFRPNMAFGYMSPYEKKYKCFFNKTNPENNLLSWWGAI